MPLRFWAEAFQTVAYIIHILLTPVLQNKSPFDNLFHQQPAYSELRSFGCACYPYLRHIIGINLTIDLNNVFLLAIALIIEDICISPLKEECMCLDM